MIPYKLEFVIEETNSAELAAQGLLQAYTGKVIPRYLSERLGRDVGNRVAAVDFLENFYEPVKRPQGSGSWSRFFKNVRSRVGPWIATYLSAKEGLTPL
jgi:hypothetical protein